MRNWLSLEQQDILAEELQERLNEVIDEKAYKKIIFEYQNKGLDVQHLLVALTGELNDLCYSLNNSIDVMQTCERKIYELLGLINYYFIFGGRYEVL